MGTIQNKDKERQKRFWKNKPASAHANYQLYKFFITLTDEELMVLFKKRKEQCKHSNNEEIKQLRTEMAIINDIIQERKKEIFIYNE